MTDQPTGHELEREAIANDPLEMLVDRFAKRLLAKLKLARANGRYGWDLDNWEAECQAGLLRHLEKGDPRDVAAYCAFMDHHGWITKAPSVSVDGDREDDLLMEFQRSVGATTDEQRDAFIAGVRLSKVPAPHQSCGVQSADDIRWAVNVLLEKIAEKFDQWDTHDIWRSDAAATVRGFKHDLAALSPERAKSEPTDEEIETDMHYIRNQLAMKRDSEAHRMLREQFGSPAVSSAESKSHG